MADTQYVPLGQGNAPAGWTLPTGLQINPKVCYASFNGTGAAGSYVPCLRLVSDSGHVAAECVVGTTVAAGASADVSWFRGNVGSSSSGGGGTTPVVAIATTIFGTIPNVPAGGTALVSFDHVGSTDTSQAYWAATSGTPPTAAPPNIYLHFKKPALGTVWFQVSCIWPAGTKIDCRMFSPDGFDIPHDGWDSFSGYDSTASAADGPQLMDVSFMSISNPTGDVPIAVRLTNSDAGASAPEVVQFMCIYYPGLFANLV